jgi:preprotein translocase subunit YajC
MPTLIFILVLFVFAWFFLVLPSRRRQRSHQSMQDSVKVGDEIITAGGLHGVVTEQAVEDVRLEIAPGVIVTLDRRAIAAVAEDLEPDEDDEPEAEDGAEEAEGDEPDEGGVDASGEEGQAEESLKG